MSELHSHLHDTTTVNLGSVRPSNNCIATIKWIHQNLLAANFRFSRNLWFLVPISRGENARFAPLHELGLEARNTCRSFTIVNIIISAKTFSKRVVNNVDSDCRLEVRISGHKNPARLVKWNISYLQPAPVLASAGPDLKHFCGAPLSGV